MKGKTNVGKLKAKYGAMLRLVKPGEALAKPTAAQMALTEAAVEKSMRHFERLAPGNKLAYNVQEAAEAIGVSPWYVRDEMSVGRLGFSSARGRKIIPRWELVRYLEEYMQGASEAAGDETEQVSKSQGDSVHKGNPTLKTALSGAKKRTI
jgi:hypothetical protein